MRRFLLFLSALSVCAGAFWLVGRCFRTESDRAPGSEMVENPMPSVITSMRSLARLEGAQFHMERIIDLKDKQSRLRGFVEAEDALLLVAVGDVIAGVDLSRVVEADIEVSNDQRSVRMRLPRAEVFSASLDSSRTYVHSRKTDVLAERNESLETQARARAQESLRKGAIDAGILVKAETSVERSVTALLLSLGFDRVEVTFDESVSADRGESR